MRQKIYEVNGFAYTDPQEYEEAKKEAESIEYMKANTDLSNLKEAAKLYLKLVEHKSLRTVVGYTFLKELQDSIIKQDFMKMDNLPGIQIINHVKNANALYDMLKKPENKQEEILTDYRIRLKNLRIISIFLLVIIIVMMCIAIFT